jgi:zinc and cadmium transporter
MNSIWFYSLISVVIVSFISLIGVFTLTLSDERIKKSLLYLVSFAAGALLGDAFLHLVPEAFELSDAYLLLSTNILVGIIVFFILEKFIYWRHCHIPTSDNHPHTLGTINLVGDGLHNFIDGVILGASYLVSIPLGITTTIAILLHEIPQEIGDFSILLHAGYTKKKALFFNVLSASVAIVGTVLVLLVGDNVQHLVDVLVPFTIGGFIYIAAADLLPEIHREGNTYKSVFQLVFFLLGIGLMALLLLLG